MEEDGNSLIYKDCLLSEVLKCSSPDLPSVCLFDIPDLGGFGFTNFGHFSTPVDFDPPKPAFNINNFKNKDLPTSNCPDFKLNANEADSLTGNCQSSTGNGRLSAGNGQFPTGNGYMLAGNGHMLAGPGNGQNFVQRVANDVIQTGFVENSKDHCYISDSNSSSKVTTSWQHFKQPIHNKYKSQIFAKECANNFDFSPVNAATGCFPCKPEIPLDINEPEIEVISAQPFSGKIETDSSRFYECSALTPEEHLSDGSTSSGCSEYFTASASPLTFSVYTLPLANGQDCPAPGPLRSRSKMHDLALKHNLITNQNTKSNGQLILSSEERRTLMQEGFSVPCSLPLTKKEEEALKLVRRKIKNKLSAQESRRRRKEYIDALEKKLENCETENSTLRRRVDNLEQNNQNLLGQLRKLQSLVGLGPSSDQISAPKTTGVALTALFLIFAIIIPTLPVWPQISFLTQRYHPAAPSSVAMATGMTGGEAFISPNLGAFGAQKDQFRAKNSRILSSGGAEFECGLPYSANFFEKPERCPILATEGAEEGPPEDQFYLATDQKVDELLHSVDPQTGQNDEKLLLNCSSENCKLGHVLSLEKAPSMENDCLNNNCKSTLVLAK